SWHLRVLTVPRTGITRSCQHKRIATLGAERRDRVEPDIRRDRSGVGVEAIEERVGVRLSGVRHVAALSVEDHRDVIRYRLQGQSENVHRRGPVPLIESEVRLVRAYVVGG